MRVIQVPRNRQIPSSLPLLWSPKLPRMEGRPRFSGAVFWQRPALLKNETEQANKQTNKTQLTKQHQQKQLARAAGSAGRSQPRSPETAPAYGSGSRQQQGSPHPAPAPLGGISAASGHPDSFYFKGHTRCEAF